MEISPPTNKEIEEMIDKDFIERAKGIGPSSWEEYARSLKYAADVIYGKYKTGLDESMLMGGRMNVPFEEPYERDLRLKSTYYLLMGLSIENLVKGIVIIRHPEYLKNNTELNKERLGTHNTNWLLKSNSIYGFTDYAEILNALSQCVIWASKYPVPFKREKFDWGYDWVDPEAINKLYENLCERLHEEKDKLAQR